MFYCREEITEPTSSSSKKSSVAVLDLSGGKKIRKFYVLVPDRWNLAEKIEKDSFLEFKNKFSR